MRIATKNDTSTSNSIFLVIASVTALCFLNILYFINQAGSPIIQSDAWYFLDTVIRKWSQTGVNFSDLFMKRSLSDHAQPINKIILLFNYKFFNLDFRLESLMGFLGQLAFVGIFLSIYIGKMISRPVNWLSAISFSGALLIITSLNSTEIYTWPLVTYGFLIFFFAISISLLTWNFLTSDLSISMLVVSAFLMLLIGDTGSAIVWASISATIAIFYLNGDKNYRCRSIQWGVTSTIFVISYYLILNSKLIVNDVGQTTSPVDSPVIWNDPLLYVEALRIVFSSSLVHVSHLSKLGGYSLPGSWVISCLVFFFYLKFFVVLFTEKKRPSIDKFIPTFILLYATVSVIAIIFGRLPVFGISYLNQHRYVMTYQLIPFALMIDWAFSIAHKQILLKKWKQTLFLTASFTFFSIQTSHVIQAYRAVPYISKHEDMRAKAIGTYLLQPTSPSGNCTIYNNTLCQMSTEKRNELLNILDNEQLNLFNPTFQWKYRFFPFYEQSSELMTMKVLNWGPQIIKITDDPVGIWISLDHKIRSTKSHFIVKFDGKNITPVVSNNVVTFFVPKNITATIGKYSVNLIDDAYSQNISVGNFEVTR